MRLAADASTADASTAGARAAFAPEAATWHRRGRRTPAHVLRAGQTAGGGGADMMAVEAFRRSLSDAGPPAGSDLALQALWWAGKGAWERAHGCAQRREGDPDCDLVHAHLHRVEGDPANAAYWYRRAGRRAATAPLDEEWADIAAHLLSRAQGA